jgi:hypothetical protein
VPSFRSSAQGINANIRKKKLGSFLLVGQVSMGTRLVAIKDMQDGFWEIEVSLSLSLSLSLALPQIVKFICLRYVCLPGRSWQEVRVGGVSFSLSVSLSF